MKRRSFLTGAAAASAAVATGTVAAPAIATGKRQLKMVTSWPKNFPGLGTAAARVAQRITDATDGRLTVKVYAAKELVGPFEVLDAVGQGTADMYHSAEYYFQGKNKGFNFFAAVPFGLTAVEQSAWINHAGGQKLWDDLSAGFGVKPFLCGNSGVQWGGWFNKEINTAEDMKGLKIRMPGLGGEVLRRLGAAAVALPGGEIFPSLQSGAIDATEWVGPWNDLAFGFYKVTKFYYYPGFHEPGTALAMGMNKKLWDSLSKADQALVTACAGAENDYSLAEFTANNSGALDTLVNKHKVQLREMPDAVLKAAAEASNQVLADVAKGDDQTRAILDSFTDFRTKAMRMSGLSDAPFMRARQMFSKG